MEATNIVTGQFSSENFSSKSLPTQSESIGNIALALSKALIKFSIPIYLLSVYRMYRCKDIVTNNCLVNQDRIFEVVTIPRHEGHSDITTKRKFTKIC